MASRDCITKTIGFLTVHRNNMCRKEHGVDGYIELKAYFLKDNSFPQQFRHGIR
jgi:hypothetical protein